MTDAEWNALHGNPEDNAHLEPETERLTVEQAADRIAALRKAALEPKPEPKWWAWEEEVQEERRK